MNLQEKTANPPLFLAHFEINHEPHWTKKFRLNFPELNLEGHILNVRKDSIIEGHLVIKPRENAGVITESRVNAILNWFNEKNGFYAKPKIVDDKLLLLKTYEKDVLTPSVVRKISEAGGKIPSEIGQTLKDDGIESLSAFFTSKEQFRNAVTIMTVMYGNQIVKQPFLHGDPGLCTCNVPLMLESLVGEPLPQHRGQINEYYKGNGKHMKGKKWHNELTKKIKKKNNSNKVLQWLLKRD